MRELIYAPEFEGKVRAAMAVPDARGEFVAELRSQIVKQAGEMPGQSTPLLRGRMAWAAPLLIVLALLITTLVIGPQKVWAAVRGLFGYVPGIGYVQTDGGLLALPEPVQVEREGITLIVEQVVADSERTVVVYKVSGLSVQAANSQGEGAVTGSMELLRLGNGEELLITNGEARGWGSGYRARLVFPALPESISEFSFVVPRLQSMPPGAAPEDWEVTLTLEPAAGEITLLPVEEISPEPDETTAGADEAAAAAEDQDIIFALTRVVELEDGFLFEGTLEWVGEEKAAFVYANGIQVVDALGERVPSEEVTPDELYAPHTATAIGWAIRTYSKAQPGPWEISLPRLGIELYPDISFSVDLGQAPQVGDQWQVDQQFIFSEIEFDLLSIFLEEDSRQNSRLSFNFSGPDTLIGVSLFDPNYQPQGGGGGGGGSGGSGGLTSSMDYDVIPVGVREISIYSIVVERAGDWQISWQPPETSEAVVEQAQPLEVCLTSQSWEDLKAAGAGEGADQLSGDLLLLTHTGQRLPVISLLGMDSDFRQEYGIGAWISLSPDGSTIAVPGDDGIYLVDAASGAYTYLPGSYGADYPLWSLDGEQIAFHVWNDASIYRVNLDGSNLTRVYQGNDVVYPSAWTPDGEKIVYLAFGDEGMAVKAVRIADGQTEVWIQTHDNKPIARPRISPDGEWVVFADVLEGQPGKGIYIARIDGSERRLLAAFNDYSQASLGMGVWSPDGEWFVLNIHDFSFSQSNPVPVLVSVSTCQVIPLFDVSGEVVGWRP